MSYLVWMGKADHPTKAEAFDFTLKECGNLRHLATLTSWQVPLRVYYDDASKDLAHELVAMLRTEKYGSMSIRDITLVRFIPRTKKKYKPVLRANVKFMHLNDEEVELVLHGVRISGGENQRMRYLRRQIHDEIKLRRARVAASLEREVEEELTAALAAGEM